MYSIYSSPEYQESNVFPSIASKRPVPTKSPKKTISGKLLSTIQPEDNVPFHDGNIWSRGGGGVMCQLDDSSKIIDLYFWF